jgi:hypothetical protein
VKNILNWAGQTAAMVVMGVAFILEAMKPSTPWLISGFSPSIALALVSRARVKTEQVQRVRI